VRVAGADALDAAGGGGELDALRDIFRTRSLPLNLRELAAARLAPEGALVVHAPAVAGGGLSEGQGMWLSAMTALSRKEEDT
jgi:hypothetical protein